MVLASVEPAVAVVYVPGARANGRCEKLHLHTGRRESIRIFARLRAVRVSIPTGAAASHDALRREHCMGGIQARFRHESQNGIQRFADETDASLARPDNGESCPAHGICSIFVSRDPYHSTCHLGMHSGVEINQGFSPWQRLEEKQRSGSGRGGEGVGDE